MTRSPSTRRGKRGLEPFSTIQLAFQRGRQTWGLLLITGVGIVAAVTLICTVPLYSKVAMTAGLRSVLNSNPQYADIDVSGVTAYLSLSMLHQVNTSLDRTFQKDLGSYLGASQFFVQTGFFPILDNSVGPLHETGDKMSLIGASMEQSAAHVHLVAGRLPVTSSQAIEVALRMETATNYHLAVGSTLPLHFTLVGGDLSVVSRVLMLHIVGIFTLPMDNDPYWHGIDFQGVSTNGVFALSQALASNDTILQTLAQLVSDPAVTNRVYQIPSNLYWYYRLDTNHISIDQLDNVIAGIQSVKVDNSNNGNLDQSPFLEQVSTYQSSDILDQYRSRTAVAQLPVVSFLFFVSGLVLFFIIMMAGLLVERQSEAIAVLRSRGASRRQIFGAMVIQSVVLGLIALVAGPLLAIVMTRLLTQNLLPATDQGALNLLAGNPVSVALGLSQYATGAALITVIAMSLAVLGAANRDILAIRREAARTTQRPLWQRLNLDVVAAIIALVGFIFSIYATNANVLDARLRLLLLSPLSLLGTIFLLLAGLLLLVRFFPLLLQGGAWLAARRRGATPLLALAQMARAPRQSARMTLFLALASAFAIFTLIFSATQTQRVLEVAAYQAGADFSGTVPLNLYTPKQLPGVTATYRHLPGVMAASLGFVKSATGGGPTAAINIDFKAVDTDTFAQTAIWTDQYSTQSLDSLMAQLRGQRSYGITHLVVPAIVDTSTWNLLHLTQGATFTLNFSPIAYSDLVNFKAIAEVQNIPTSGDSSTPGVLADFKTYADVYTQHFTRAGDYAVPLNYVWLRTSDDPALLVRLRQTLTQGDLQLNPLSDRRAIITSLYQEPLYLTLIGILSLGAVLALLLALGGNLLSSWLSARSRLVNFAVLRALGAAPRQVAGVLAWEQGIIYTTAILQGILFGIILSLLAIPALIFSSVLPNQVTGNLSAADFYAVQTVPAVNIVMPASLGIALGILAVICLIAISLMMLVVARPSIGQALRVNQD